MQWGPVKETAEDGTPTTRFGMIREQCNVQQLLERLAVAMGSWLYHQWRAAHQQREFQRCISTFPPEILVMAMDFSENIKFAPDGQPQSGYFATKQGTIFILITWHRPAPGQPAVKTVHYYVSDDTRHSCR